MKTKIISGARKKKRTTEIKLRLRQGISSDVVFNYYWLLRREGQVKNPAATNAGRHLRYNCHIYKIFSLIYLSACGYVDARVLYVQTVYKINNVGLLVLEHSWVFSVYCFLVSK